MRMTLSEISSCLRINNFSESCAEITSVVTDSRAARKGSLFVCIPGQNVDGHDFAAKALDLGATAILAEKNLPGLEKRTFLVNNTIKSLGMLASAWRKKCNAKVLCVTGTSGKTTLKEILVSVLSCNGKTSASRLNHNNQIGLPCSILEADGDEKFWIMEAGISHPGDMEELGSILWPDVAVILNVGTGHVEGLGKKGVAWHKTRLLNYLTPGGNAILNADYPELVAEACKMGKPTVLFAVERAKGADYSISCLDQRKNLFLISTPHKSFQVSSPFIGKYGRENILAAAVCADIMGVSPSEIRAGISKAKLPPHRMALEKLDKWHLLDDAYNANPLSMRRMLEAASTYARSLNLPLLLVLGEMGELGDQSEECHNELGRFLGRIAPEMVFWKGNYAFSLKNGLDEDETSFEILTDVNAEDLFKEAITNNPKFEKGGVVLFKGSRINRLEEAVAKFKAILTKGKQDVL